LVVVAVEDLAVVPRVEGREREGLAPLMISGVVCVTYLRRANCNSRMRSLQSTLIFYGIVRRVTEGQEEVWGVCIH
jgi:hypothetical protein